ncbi:sodium:proton antiporter [Glaciecola sp. MH2013]|uniref:Na+/H+ antiporter NhaC family protein n=1 Tax=Glaciecola sp. MH2013 TaxID=2785524 RepID=UPI00189E5013|nr:Na+/H+ antiporter NhaC family protein [Glaciecola sp. MH2013]MBF7074008.1 sodium:proton antiporter [Glaciecola sp. MH2013]
MDWLTILPPLVAISVVLWKKEVILALLLAVLSSELLLAITTNQTHWLNTPINTIERIITTAGNGSTTRILVFSLLVGALLAFIRDSGGVSATVNRLIGSGFVNSKKRVGGVTMFTGMAIFIESNLSVLTAGIFARGLFDKYKMSRARLAYIIDSTCAPICILILLNGWGAYVLALISTYDLKQDAISVLWGTLPYNIYAWLTLVVVGYTIISDKVHGPMKEAEQNLESTNTQIDASPATKSRFMIVPLLVMVIGMFAFMLLTGNGDITQGSGSKSVLYATFLAGVVAYLQLLWNKRFNHQESLKIGFNGMGELLPLVTIVLLSIALGASLKELGTGLFVSSIVGEHLPLILVVPMLFIAGAIMSFTTGTSWGTFAILIPIGMPLVASLGLPPSLVLAAILGGGIFGDHCSPISDTTAVSSLAAGCDILEHVKTQMPYALFVGAITIAAYLLLSVQVFF